MSRPPKPWYRKARRSWCVYLDGKQHNLGPDREEALQRFHALMASQPKKPTEGSLAALLDAFVVFSEDHKAASTARWYRGYLQDFIDYLRLKRYSPGSLPPEELTPRLVRAWADQRGAKRGRITAVKAAYRWGHAEGWLRSNPIAAMKRPPATKRDDLITLEDVKRLLRLSDRGFRDLLIVLWDTGARPQELRCLRSDHLDLPHHRCVLPLPESKGKRRERVIYLTPRAERIVRRRDQGGHIFRNSKGAPWTASAVKCRFVRLEKELGKRVCQYHFRHSFATRKLKEGLSPIVVAELLGHEDASTLAKVYQHVSQDPTYLLEALNRKSA